MADPPPCDGSAMGIYRRQRKTIAHRRIRIGHLHSTWCYEPGDAHGAVGFPKNDPYRAVENLRHVELPCYAIRSLRVGLRLSCNLLVPRTPHRRTEQNGKNSKASLDAGSEHGRYHHLRYLAIRACAQQRIGRQCQTAELPFSAC